MADINALYRSLLAADDAGDAAAVNTNPISLRRNSVRVRSESWSTRQSFRTAHPRWAGPAHPAGAAGSISRSVPAELIAGTSRVFGPRPRLPLPNRTWI
jgi:hypothetical protein